MKVKFRIGDYVCCCYGYGFIKLIYSYPYDYERIMYDVFFGNYDSGKEIIHSLGENQLKLVKKGDDKMVAKSKEKYVVLVKECMNYETDFSSLKEAKEYFSNCEQENDDKVYLICKCVPVIEVKPKGVSFEEVKK
jgi:hypothetical protein